MESDGSPLGGRHLLLVSRTAHALGQDDPMHDAVGRAIAGIAAADAAVMVAVTA